MREILFIGLNMADAKLTQIALTMGALELNPLMQQLGGNILAKGLLAMAIVALLRRFYRTEPLKWANIGIFGVVVWNTVVIFRMLNIM